MAWTEPATAPRPRADADRPTSARDQILTGAGAARYRSAVHDAVNRIAHRFTEVKQPFTGVSHDEMRRRHEKIDLDRPLEDLAAALSELDEVYLDDAVWFHDPKYLAHLNCPVVLPAVVGEAFNAAVNTSVDTWDQSAGATVIEQRLVDWACGLVGFGEESDGVFTSGGTLSNLQALFIAREEAQAKWGADSLPRLRIIASEVGHFSVQKAARLLGLGRESVVAVPVDGEQHMDLAALRRALDDAEAAGDHVAAVVATAGTTDYGSVDRLRRIAEITDGRTAWLHVDAAYGCGLLVSPTRRHLLDGIELADSVTVDFHKSYFQPVSSSAVLVKQGGKLGHTTYYADYLNPRTSPEPNLVDKSLQTTRRFDAIKLWLTLRAMGPEQIGVLFDQVCDLADDVWKAVDAHPDFETVTGPSELSTVLFRLKGDDELQRRARRALAEGGTGLVAATVHEGRQVLKLTLLNPLTTVADVMEVLDGLAAHNTEGPNQ
ncbi:pyridoxal phosphate-dependent decarboxylase family protein [Salininema proteolyticum]|uniref:Pyridoxal phosphate-dependent decarboxylase family protein n=1 Tax=Salininema proteolyticum TaxID=1607685 RepID=A0ABV8U513_9ACTN